MNEGIPPELFVPSCLRVENGDLLARARKERLSPLLYYCFQHRGWPESIPTDVRRELRKDYYASAAHNLDLLNALSETSEALETRGIEAVAIKGADLAQNLYPNVALRPMGDIDLYVRPDDADGAEEVLSELGYEPWCPDMTPGLARRTRHARLFTRNKGSVAIDLHWSLVAGREDTRAPHDAWFRDNLRRDAHGPWMRLSTSAHLLYLAAHMKLQHYDEENPLLWLVDFRLLAMSGEIEWERLFTEAAELDWTDALVATAADVRERLGVSLPEPLAQFVAGRPVPSSETVMEPALAELKTLSWRARLALVRALVLPSPSYMRFRYANEPRGWFFGYPLRWWTILRTTLALVLETSQKPTETC